MTAPEREGLKPIEVIRVQQAQAAMKIYQTHGERSAMRCVLGDAAALLDALARDIAAENRGRNGKGAVTKLGLQLEEIAKRCADQVWLLREEITHPSRAAPTTEEE